MRVKRAGTATLLGLMVLAACADGGFLSAGGGGGGERSTSFYGMVIADEPTAATVGRRILEEGGNAADAATATYFALAVTYPVAAALGGGGVCSIYYQSRQTVESIEFLAREAQGGGAFAIPGNIRGFALLQARYGKLNWAQLISPAENLSQNGFSASRALIRRLAPLSFNANAGALINTLYQSEGRALDEGVVVKYPAITPTLAQVRVAGASNFYEGGIAQKLQEAARLQGGALSDEDLRAFRPQVASLSPTLKGDRAVFLPGSRIGAGAFAQALWPHVSASGVSAAVVETAATSAANAFGVQDLADDFGSTSFVAVDGDGNAVACAVTMGKPLGAAVHAADTGVIFAPNPASGVEGFAGAFLTTVLVTDDEQERLYFAGAGAGSPKASASVIFAAATGGPVSDVTALAGGQTAALNVFSCPGGFSQGGNTCTGWADARAYGVALEAATPALPQR